MSDEQRAMYSGPLIAYLAIVELEDKFGFGTVYVLADQLRGYPALGGVRLPRPRTNIIR